VVSFFFFFFFGKRGQKLCPDLFIKKKRIAQLINGKLDKNRYNKATREQRQNISDLQTNRHTQPTTNANKRHQEHHTVVSLISIDLISALFHPSFYFIMDIYHVRVHKH
jgi:hypothetical protein